MIEDDEWLVVVPFWAVWPFETLLVPERPVARLPDLADAARDALAGDLIAPAAGVRPLFEPAVPVLDGLAPGARSAAARTAHWQLHAHVYPPLLRSATSASSWSATSCWRSRSATSRRRTQPSGCARPGSQPTAMRAMVFAGPREMPLDEERPDLVPGSGTVVVAVRAAGICGSDVHGFLGATGRRRPGIVMGHEAAGDVVEVGPGVTSVRAGDRVVLKSILACGECDRCRSGRPNLCPERQRHGDALRRRVRRADHRPGGAPGAARRAP